MPPIRNNRVRGKAKMARSRRSKPYDKYGTIIRSQVMSPSSTTEPRALYYVVGNTYRKKRSPNNRRWRETYILYVDIVAGDADLISKVKFDFLHSAEICCYSPVTTYLEDGTQVLRFSTGIQHIKRRRIIVSKIRIEGRGGTMRYATRRIVLRPEGSGSSRKLFHEPRRFRPWRCVAMPHVMFGIELEVSCARGTPSEDVARYIVDHAHVQGWKIVYDSSIACSIHNPKCSKFELVSPILTGGQGLLECYRVLRALSDCGMIRVNKSMGFHVHVNVETLALPQLIKVCQNFIKYEDAIDTFMPPSRRTGSEESNNYCQSNKLAIIRNDASSTNVQRHKKIASCTTIPELCEVMNPYGRYYKLNLYNLKTGRQPTVEFRQHSATSNYNKISAWVRFCVAFVYNSAKYPRPASLKDSRSTDEQLDMLFQYVIKDRALREVYEERRDEVNEEEDECCTNCAHGGACSALKNDLFLP